MRAFTTLGLVAGLTLGGAFSASANIIDFTEIPAGFTLTGNTGSGSINGINYTLQATPIPAGILTNAESGPGAANTGGNLAGDRDGLGVIRDGVTDDEVTFGTGESITIDFGAVEVRVDNIFFLDLFAAKQTGAVGESVELTGSVSDTFVATATDGIGFFDAALDAGAGLGLGLVGTTFTFTAGPGDDLRTGDPDFALAGLEVFTTGNFVQVPLPAGVLLLGGALAGLGFTRRLRRKA